MSTLKEERGPCRVFLSTGPEFIAIPKLHLRLPPFLDCLVQPDAILLHQPDVVEIHCSRTTGGRATLCSKANGNGIDVGKVHARKRL